MYHRHPCPLTVWGYVRRLRRQSTAPLTCVLSSKRALALVATPQGTKINSKGKEVAHGTRLYSIASSRYGDSFDGQTASLCVRRANYYDPETGVEDPSKKGLASNFLTDAAPGTEIMMTGGCASPAGRLRAAQPRHH